jgi:hypothetical protein
MLTGLDPHLQQFVSPFAVAQSALEVQSLTVPLNEQFVGAPFGQDAAAVQADVSCEAVQFGGAPPVSVNDPQQTWPPVHCPVTPASGRSVAPTQSTE